ncbi:MAG: GNAT family N-acetyltransferase [Thermoleophilia bacterium]|nr:GNAT family N-acetyltransferase [Thermoleophilia bacterium]
MSSRLEIRPLQEELLDDASALLAERHARHRAVEPLLPQAGGARRHLEAALAREGASGAAAIAGGQLVGYLVGAPVGERRIEVGLAGHAAAEPEVARDLYAALAQDWVDAGLVHHAVYVPAHDAALVDAWFRLAFGLQFAFAVREVAAEPQFDTGVTIRPGRPDEVEAAAALERSLWEHQVGSPSFSGAEVPSLSTFVDDWASGTWDNPAFAHFVAERDGDLVGQALMYVRPTGDLRIPERAVDLAQVETLPDMRGSGVGRALFAHVMSWANAQGYAAMTTDWRSVNLLASRFWTRRGFRPTFLRLYRSVP